MNVRKKGKLYVIHWLDAAGYMMRIWLKLNRVLQDRGLGQKVVENTCFSVIILSGGQG